MSGRIFNVLSVVLAAGLLHGCKQEQQAAAPPPPEVSVVTVQTQPIVLTTELPGRTASYRVSEVKPQVSGVVIKRLFEEGSNVEAGQVLYQIDPAPFEAAHASALANVEAAKRALDQSRAALAASIATVERQRATLELARTNFRRIDQLHRENAVSTFERDKTKTDLDVAEAALHEAEAQVNSARAAVAAAESEVLRSEAALQTTQINLDYTKVRAPIAGRIGRSQVTEGAIVTAYQAMPMATIQAFDPIYVDVPQSTVDMNKLRRRLSRNDTFRKGTDDVQIILEDGTAYPEKGKLQFREASVDPTTGSVILRIVVPNPDEVLLPGMFVRAVIEEGVDEQAILVPQQAVSRDPKGTPLALVVDESGKVVQRRLTTDRTIRDQWLVTSGLSAGERVIVEGTQRVRPGMEPRVVPFAQPAATASASAN